MSTAVDSPAPALAAALRRATAALHGRAERSGVVAALFAGEASQDGYALLLRNLLPVYAAIEAGLERQRSHPAVALVARPEVYRAAAIATDLAALGATAAPLLPAGARYAHRVARADAARLIAHAYVRYLGDLSGGLAMARLLARDLALPPGALCCHAFPAIPNPEAFKVAFRAALDTAAALVDPARVLGEARVAFRLNIALGEAVQRAAAPDR